MSLGVAVVTGAVFTALITWIAAQKDLSRGPDVYRIAQSIPPRPAQGAPTTRRGLTWASFEASGGAGGIATAPMA